MSQGRPDRQQFWSFITLTTLVAFVCAIVGVLLPLGLGFQDGPTNPVTRKIALTLFAIAFYVGIPALLIGQPLSAMLWFYRRRRAAYAIPMMSIGLFLLCFVTALLIFGRP